MRLERSIASILTMFVACLAPAPLFAADPPARPNVVVFFIDDLGATDLGVYGSKYYQTPNVDRLANEGMRFTQAYAACPVCSPTRAALMTGRYPARLHLTDWIPGKHDFKHQRLRRPEFRQELPLEEITIAERLHEAGYATASIGKWHLGGDGYEPTRQGFDLNIAGDAAGSPRSYFAPYRGREGQTMKGLENAPEGEYLTERLTAEAEKFIEANRDRPFLLYLPHYAVHTPLVGKPDLVAKYEAAQPAGLQRNAVYAAMVESMDQSVGRIVAKLAALGLTENTLVIFSSDNGGLATTEGPKTPATYNGPLREGKGWLYEGGIRVPLIVKWPARIKAGTTTAEVVSTIDVPLTIAAACGVKVAEQVDGVSFLNVLTDGDALAARPLYWHYPHYSPQGSRPGGAIREGNYKLIEYYEDQRHELFDVVKDTSETTNLVEREPQLVRAMAARLAAWRQEVDAQMPAANPQFTPDEQAADGTVTLPGKNADVHSVQLRYEPLPHKRTLGFWTRVDDWVSWEFDLKKPGKFAVELLQGCGTGSGGSQVIISVGDQATTATVKDTGGFQQFELRPAGTLTIAKPGRHILSVKATSKPGVAVMDLREVRLVPVKD